MTTDRMQHDVGGLPGGPIDMGEHDLLPWHKMVSAVFTVLRIKGTLTTDELRRSIEDLPAEIYNSGYYERWAEAMVNLMVEKQMITRDDVESRLASLKAQRQSEMGAAQ